MSAIPTIDIARWGHSPRDDAEIAAAVHAACASIGFFSITGHAIRPDVLSAMIERVDEFFAQPDAVKRIYRSPSPGINRGYAAKETEALALSLGVATPPDLFEAFNVGVENAPTDPTLDAKALAEFFAPNIWPSTPSGFRAAVMRYFDAAAAQAAALLEIFAVALGEDRTFFQQFTQHSTDTMRINFYRRSPGEDEPREGQQRMGAHTDYGMVTVLYADSVPGLEILGPDGQWQGYVPSRGSLLINLGDLMAQWTNDTWRSSLHRVVPPPRHVDGPSLRRSVAFFRDGDYDALVSVLPSCSSADNPPKYQPVRAGEHLRGKLLGPRTLRPSTAASTAGERIEAVRASSAPPGTAKRA